MIYKTLPLAISLILIQGCQLTKPVEVKETIANAKAKFETPSQSGNTRFTLVDRPIMSISKMELEVKSSEWLKKQQVSLLAKEPLPIAQVIKSFNAQGINIVSNLPLDQYAFAGFTIHPTDAETALRILTSTVGLDYEVDDVHHIVEIKPMASKTWTVNVGSGAMNQGAAVLGTNNQNSLSGTSSGQLGGAVSGQSSVMGGSSTGGTTGSGTSGMGISSLDNAGSAANSNSSGGQMGGAAGAAGGMLLSGGIGGSASFWGSLQQELYSRLKVVLPSANSNQIPLPDLPPIEVRLNDRPNVQGPNGSSIQLPSLQNIGMPVQNTVGGMPQSVNNSNNDQEKNGLYRAVSIGQVVVNAQTGSVTVTAPRWKLKEIGKYIEEIQAQYNTNISIEGEMLLVSTDKSQQEGLDIQSFGRFAKQSGLLFSNNALGGMTLSMPTTIDGQNIPTASAQNFSGPMIGSINADPLRIFSAYMASKGDVKVLQKPLISTTPNVPGSFSKITTRYINSINQQAATGGVGGAAIATQNTLVPIDLGTNMDFLPIYDPKTGLVRARLKVTQKVQSGTQIMTQSLTIGSTIQEKPIEIPIITTMSQNGEVLLRDGDVIILGGQIEEKATANENGLPDSDGEVWGSPILGKKASSQTISAYYMVLRVKIEKKT